MNKDLIKQLIVEYRKFLLTVNVIERDYALDDACNYVFVGLRRAGKSYLLYQVAQRLIAKGHSPDEILYFNFEDDRIASIEPNDLELIKSCYEEMYDCRPIFFLDEIQIVPHWEKFARRLADQKYHVYISGSNAKMLSSEIATTLGGRFVAMDIFPLSFREFLRFSGININDTNTLYNRRTDILKAGNDYFDYGGLPELLQIKDKRTWLSSLFNKLFFGDIITRHNIRNDYALRVLIRKLTESIKQPLSYTRMAHAVSAAGKKLSTDAAIDYTDYLEEAWLILPLENINAKLADKESNRKYYFIDNSILELFLLDSDTSKLENMIAIQLRQTFGKNVFFYHNGVEVDFYIPDEKMAIQASYSLDATDTIKREIKALDKLSECLPCNKRFIITRHDEGVFTTPKGHIQALPIWKWQLNLMS